MKRNAHGLVVAAAAMLAGWSAHGQEAEPFAKDLAESTRVVTSLEAGADFTDNFYYTDTSRTQTDATGFIVRPDVLVTRVVPRFQFTGSASAEFGWFDVPGSFDDYADYEFTLGSEWRSAARHRFSFVARHREDHDPFGTERTEGTILESREIDEWREPRMDVAYRYGLPTDRYNLELRTYGRRREYTNNRDFTVFLDREAVNGQLLAYYNFTVKTSVFVNILGTRTVYELRPGEPGAPAGLIDRGGNEMRYLLGTRWLATGKTSGDIRLGYTERRPHAPNREEVSGLDWRGSVSWSPRSTTGVIVDTGRTSRDSYLTSVDFIDSRYVGVDWSEHWTLRLSTRMTARYIDSDFIGIARTDQSLGYSVKGEYILTPFLKLLGLASLGQQDSDADFAEHDRFYVYIGARYTR